MTEFLRVDDLLAALILSLVMMRRIEVRTARSEDNPSVPAEKFAEWRHRALRAYDWVAWSSLVKIVASVGWLVIAVRLHVGAPWLQLGGFSVFLGWLLSLVWAWKAATDASHLRRELGIQLRSRQARSADSKPGQRSA